MSTRRKLVRKAFRELDKALYLIEFARENALTQELGALYAGLGRHVAAIFATFSIDAAATALLAADLERLRAAGETFFESPGGIYETAGLAAFVASVKRTIKDKLAREDAGQNRFAIFLARHKVFVAVTFCFLVVLAGFSTAILFARENTTIVAVIADYFKDYSQRYIWFDVLSDNYNKTIVPEVTGFSLAEYNKKNGEQYCWLTSRQAQIVIDSKFSGKLRMQLELNSPTENQNVVISINGQEVRRYAAVTIVTDTFTFNRVPGRNVITLSIEPTKEVEVGKEKKFEGIRNEIFASGEQQLFAKVKELKIFTD
jgi:hypothetical protein